MATTLKDSVIHWRKKLEKNTDEDIILNVIRKLSKVPMTIEILQETHIGKTIRSLSKRSDIVGEKALAVLKKWRVSFANEEPATKASKTVNNTSKKENINKKDSSKSVSKHDIPREKSHQKEASYEHKHKHKKTSNSVSLNSSEHAENYMNGDCDINNSSAFSHLYTYEKNETKPKSVDYDPNIDISEAYNPECPELYPGCSKVNKMKKLNSVETYEPSSVKRKLSVEEETNSHKNKSKKLKTESHKHVDSASVDTKQKKEKHSYHKDKNKDHKSHSSQNKMGSNEKTKQTSDSIHKSPESEKLKKDAMKKSSKSNKSKTKLKLNCTEEFTSSEVRFEDCLGFNDIVSVKKKKSVKSSQSAPTKKPLSTSNKTPVSQMHNGSTQSIQTYKTNSSPQEKYPKEMLSKEKLLNVPKPSVKLEEVDIVSTLPQTQPNYRPLPQRSFDPSPVKKKVLTNEEAIKFTSSRREKTAVYSGRRSYYTEVPSLYECCTRVLIENIDAIEFMGEVPYFLLKPVLERCTPEQLFNIEKFNPYLVAETSELWEVHCKRDFRLLSRQENETWRELYLRAHDEQEKRLKCVTANITASMGKSGPARQVKLAYVDTVVKPPRDVARRQAKNGTAVPVNHTVKATTTKPTTKPISPAISSSSSSAAPVIPKKPKVAPLMAKTLKSMKQCFRR